MLKTIALAVTFMALAGFCAGAQDSSGDPTPDSKGQNMDAPKILIAYFSRTGNTRTVAEKIHAQVGGDMFELATAEAYPDDYNATTRKAKDEQETNQRPALKGTVDDMASYDVVYVGYPNWWGTIPMAFFTFFEQYDFSGKTIIPFCTHGGSALGRSMEDIGKLCPNSTVLQGLAVSGSRAADSDQDVTEWLRRIGQLQ